VISTYLLDIIILLIAAVVAVPVSRAASAGLSDHIWIGGFVGGD